jgi:hypothetical protein
LNAPLGQSTFLAALNGQLTLQRAKQLCKHHVVR